MKKGLIGKKIGMTQIFDEKGNIVPVTVINAGPCVVVQKKTQEKDGYSAVKLGFEDIAERKLSKPLKGEFTKAGVSFKKYLKEFRLDNASELEVGATLTSDVFQAGDKIDVTGVSKGHGFSGVIKRWGCHRLRMTHGTGPVHRQAGSMGANSDPSRIMKNKKMAGQYGNVQVTVLNLEIVKVDAERNLLAVKGAVPGARGGIVFVRNTVK
ncbi:MAG: 50S ribosomal protein L3 [Clostridia bacterium]|jgi:large subunit ribosomal protein L3|nr:50S ribosomal protein L3 [Clostridia bacterium]MBO7548919.1 50S ribosomal protein L3 [Clostridia bacterium]MBP5237782.1 50S ribosomal protein L3 [Clostridia bacterium]MBP5754272.1 50S ribosomal protein L3 [Clostridia bacterium]